MRHHQISVNKLEDVLLFEDVLPLKMCRGPLLCSKVLERAFNFMSIALKHALKWVFL